MTRPEKPRGCQKHLLPCPTWNTPLYEIVADGIIFKCHNCRGKLHHVSRSMLEQFWDAQAQGRNPFAEPAGE